MPFLPLLHPNSRQPPEAADAATLAAHADWLATVLPHRPPPPAPDQATLTARVLANEVAMFGRRITRLRRPAGEDER